MNAPMELSLGYLASAWMAAKATEDKAKQDRLDIESLLVARMPPKEEGAVSESADGLKVSVTYKMNRKVDDAEALKAEWNALPAVVQDAFTWKPDVSITQLRALEKAAPDQYAQALRFITTAPAKPSIKVEAK